MKHLKKSKPGSTSDAKQKLFSVESDDDSSSDSSSDDKSPTVSQYAPPNWTCDCVLDLLRYKPFSTHSFEEQSEIIKKGRPTPELAFTREKKGRGVCKFQTIWYRKNTWLCGCLKTQKMYCWPCVLFSSSKTSSWADLDHGISDLPNFSLLRQRHVALKEHISALVQMERFGKQPITINLSNAEKSENEEYNKIVHGNRYVLTRMIDMFCFLRTQAGTVSDINESKVSLSASKYAEYLHTMQQVDPVLAHHLHHATLAPENPNTTDDMILAISQVLNESTKTEISHCNFVSLIVMSEPGEDTTKLNVSTAVRYMCNHEVRERFIKFEEMSTDRTIAMYLSFITKVLKEFDCRAKIVCHTYDGATVKCGHHMALQRYVRTKYSSAVFIPSHTPHLCWVLQQSIRSSSKDCDAFFQTCSEVASFFSEEHHAGVFVNILGWEASRVSSWKFIYLLKNAYDIVKTLLCDMATGDRWDITTRSSAAELLFAVKRKKFQFILALLSQLFLKAEAFYNTWLERIYDPPYCEKMMNNFNLETDELRQSVANEWDEDAEYDETGAPCKTPRLDLESNPLTATKSKTPQVLASDIVVHAKAVVRERYGNLGDWEFLSLLNTAKFPEMLSVFPSRALQSLESAYENHFEMTSLKGELQVLYGIQDCRSKPLDVLFDYMRSSRMCEALPQVYRLVELFLCLPVSLCDSAIDLLSTARSKLNPAQLALLSIDRKSLRECSRSSMFYDQVITKFRAGREGDLELRYKI